MRKILKKKITKGILLFLFTFFSVGVQGQYNENGQPQWSATAVGQMIVNALNTSDSWQSAQSFFVKDQEGNFVRIDFALDDVVVTSISGSINFDYSDDEENLFYELVDLTELSPEELAQARATVQEIPDCPKWYVWDGVQCVLKPESERRPCEDAFLSNHVYSTKQGAVTSGAGLLPSGTTIVPKSLLPKGKNGEDFVLTETASSFNSTMYRVDHGNGNIEYVYATEGTVSLSDWKNDAQQALGYESAQYKLSVDNARQLQIWAKDNGYTLSFTGHSLGGGLANANALATGLKAAIYNPAGLHDNTIANLQLDLSNSKNVIAYVVQGEPVSAINYAFGTPVRGTTKDVGTVFTAVMEYGSAMTKGHPALGLVKFGLAAYKLHSMGHVLDELDCN